MLEQENSERVVKAKAGGGQLRRERRFFSLLGKEVVCSVDKREVLCVDPASLEQCAKDPKDGELCLRRLKP